MPDTLTLALDRSVRRVDADGHLHVERCILSAAVVSPYYGREIPRSEAPGLKPDEVYWLYRCPDALAEAAPTMNGKPIIETHQPVRSDDHPREITVGAVNNCRFEKPDLVGELSIWDGDAIQRVQDGSKRCVSAGYAYTAVPEAGEIDGQSYTLKMVDIRFNHLALVEEPRVKTAIIGDHALSPTPRKKVPNMAQNRPTQRAREANRIHRALRDGVLAQDSSLDDIRKLLALDEKDEDEAEDEEDDKGRGAEDEEKDDDKKAEDDEEEDKDRKAEDDEDEDKDKKAQDRAIKIAVDTAVAAVEKRLRSHFKATQDARDAVRPLVGDVHGLDSANDIYRYALRQAGVDTAGVHSSALSSLVKYTAQQLRPKHPVRYAADSKSDDFNARFGVSRAPKKL